MSRQVSARHPASPLGSDQHTLCCFRDWLHESLGPSHTPTLPPHPTHITKTTPTLPPHPTHNTVRTTTTTTKYSNLKVIGLKGKACQAKGQACAKALCEGQACARALCIKRHKGSSCPRAASRARSRWHTGRGRVLANTLAWVGFPLSSAPLCDTVSCSLGTLYFDDHCWAVSVCDTTLHGQRANGQTPKIRANPFLFFSRQLASCPPTLALVRVSTVVTHGTLGFSPRHTWGSESDTPMNGLCVLMGTYLESG